MRSVIQPTPSAFLGALVLTASVAVTTGCRNIEPVAPAEPPITDPTKLYAGLTLDHPAVTLSTDTSNPAYYTLQLMATPRDAAGNPMNGLPAPTYTSSDTASVEVTPEGLLRARLATGSAVRVIAEIVSGPIRHADTALVDVTSLTPPPTLDSFSIHPGPSDSARWAALGGSTPIVDLLLGFGGYEGTFGRVTAHAFDFAGTELVGMQTEYKSLDPRVATIGRRDGQLGIVRLGQVRVVAQTVVYGVSKTDTATYTITLPTSGLIYIERGTSGAVRFRPAQLEAATFSYGDIRVRTYGIVGWVNQLADAVDVTFDDPGRVAVPPSPFCDVFVTFEAFLGPGPHCGEGDVLVPAAPSDPGNPDVAFQTIQVRQFPLPGTYTYHSTQTGATGRILVSADGLE